MASISSMKMMQGACLLGLLEQVAHAGRPHADEHLHEFTAADRKERDVGFAGDGAGQARFCRCPADRPAESLWESSPRAPGSARVLEEVDHLLQFVLGFVAAGHVVEADARVLVGDELGLALADAHHRLAHRTHATRQEVIDAGEEQ